MGVGIALALFLLFIASVDASKGDVTFWEEDITMWCPKEGDWYEDGGQTPVKERAFEYKVKYENSKGKRYYCKYVTDDTKYHFYFWGKGCENCYELDAGLFGLAIIADVVMTVVVMMIIYRCTKKKSSDRSSQASNAHPRPGGRGPPVPSPDYEHLNPRTRTQDPYSMLN